MNSGRKKIVKNTRDSPDKAKPFERRGRKAAGLEEDGRAAEGSDLRCARFFYRIDVSLFDCSVRIGFPV
jgi:hypothetical protein